MFLRNEDIECFNLNTKYFDEDNYSLNPSFYETYVELYLRMINIFKDNGITINVLDDFIEDIYVPSRAKTFFVEKYMGVPYLNPTDTFKFPLKAVKYALNAPDDCEVEDKQLLITCSGTTGRSVIANKLFDNYVISNDMIRASVFSKDLGYIYTFINTTMGQILMKRHEYGATVKHINPEHVKFLEIPIFPDIKDEINDLIIKSHKIREKSQVSMSNLQRELYDLINLPIISERDISNNYYENRCFILNSNQLDLRFDCSYHNPIYTENMKNLIDKSSSEEFKLINLEDLVDIQIPPRTKRNYVTDPNVSIPFLQGTHITQIKPQGIKRVYHKMKNIDEFVIEEGMLLLTRSGTVGRLSLVSHYWDNWAATDHIIRLKIKDNTINPGYLLLFMQSDFCQIQFDHLVYGSNVDEIGEAGDLINTIKILIPTDKSVENNLGNQVIEAYNNRDEANLIEDKAINKFEDKINECYSKLS